jgi:hypothetical protein
LIAGHGFDFLLLKTVRKMVAIPGYWVVNLKKRSSALGARGFS